MTVRALAAVALTLAGGYVAFLQLSGGGPRRTPTTVSGSSFSPAAPSLLGFVKTAFGGSMRTSEAGIEAIAKHEGFRAEVYRDAAGHPTIGYGHLIKPGETFTRITESQARDLLRDDVRTAEAAVADAVTVPLTQGQFDALVSFTFNVGTGALRASTLLRKLNAGDYTGAGAEFEKWNKAGGRVLPGLVARRAEESRLFIAGIGQGGGVYA